jgi:hypothetical protein
MTCIRATWKLWTLEETAIYANCLEIFETINFHFPTNVCKVDVYYLWFFSMQKDIQTKTYVKYEEVNNDAHT